MKQQTAVEQVFDWIIRNIEFRSESDKKRFMSNKKRFMQMEKEQIEDAYNAGVTDGYKVGRLSDDALYTDAQEYYSETYENPNT